MLFDNVVAFANVTRKVVEFATRIVVELDKFPVATADGSARSTELIGVVRVVPEKIALRLLFSAQGWEQTDSVGRTVVRSAGEIDNCLEVIVADDGAFVHTARLGYAWGADDRRLANATFVEVSLSVSKGPIRCHWLVLPLRGLQTAVIGSEDYGGVVGDPKLVEFVEHAADILIEVPDHRRIDRVVMVFAWDQSVDYPRFEAGDVFLFGLDRDVHRVVRHV